MATRTSSAMPAVWMAAERSGLVMFIVRSALGSLWPRSGGRGYRRGLVGGGWLREPAPQCLPCGWRRSVRAWSCLSFARLLEVSGREAVDVDTVEDWWVADGYANQLRNACRVDGGGAFGLGHVYRSLGSWKSLAAKRWTWIP